jgi:hypothetical protein
MADLNFIMQSMQGLKVAVQGLEAGQNANLQAIQGEVQELVAHKKLESEVENQFKRAIQALGAEQKLLHNTLTQGGYENTLSSLTRAIDVGS